jgi:hypothetical protein
MNPVQKKIYALDNLKDKLWISYFRFGHAAAGSDAVVGQPIAVRSSAELTIAYEDTQTDKDPPVNKSELPVFHELQPLFTDDVSELEPFVPFDTQCSSDWNSCSQWTDQW